MLPAVILLVVGTPFVILANGWTVMIKSILESLRGFWVALR